MISDINNYARPHHQLCITASKISLGIKVFDNHNDGMFIGRITQIVGCEYTASPAIKRECKRFKSEREAYEYIVRCWDATKDDFKKRVQAIWAA